MERRAFWFGPDDPQALANGISRLLRDSNLSEHMARAGRQRVERLFSLGQYGCRD